MSKANPVHRPWALLAMGRDNGHDAIWLQAGSVGRVVRLRHAAPSGRRRGSRALGLGLDAMTLAVKALLATGGRGPYLAANPWTGVALRLLGRRDVAITGIYASPGSRSRRTLERVLRDTPIVTTSAEEASSWTESGGRAIAVRYGNTFAYPLRRLPDVPTLRIFIGGSSDRDGSAISRLEEEIKSSASDVQLVVVDGSAPSAWSQGSTEIRRPGYVDGRLFGELIAEADVVVLPLREAGRAAGHMVLVGALEAGVPVLTNRTKGVSEYVDGRWVKVLDPDQPLLPQISAHAAGGRAAIADIHAYWLQHFSLQAYVARVSAALNEVTATPGR